MKWIRVIVCMAFLLQMTSVNCCALQDGWTDSILGNADSAAEEYLEQIGISEGSLEEIMNMDVADVFTVLKENFLTSLGQPVRIAVVCMVIVILLSVFRSVLGESEAYSVLLNAVGVAMTAFAVLSPLLVVVDHVADTMQALSVLTKTSIPVLAVLLTAAGRPAAALCIQGFSLGISQIMCSFLTKLTPPVSAVYLAFVTGNTIYPCLQTEKAGEVIRKCVTFLMSLSAGLFSAFLSLKSVLAASGDSVSSRGIKFIVGNAVPVVGSAMAEVFGSVTATVGLAKNTAAAIGLLIVFFTVVPVLVETLLLSLVFKLLHIVGNMFSQSVTAGYFHALDGLLSMLRSVVIYVAFLSVVSFLLVLLIHNG